MAAPSLAFGGHPPTGISLSPGQGVFVLEHDENRGLSVFLPKLRSDFSTKTRVVPSVQAATRLGVNKLLICNLCFSVR